MNPPNTVIEGSLIEPTCGECGKLLPVTGDHNRMCLNCHPEIEFYPSLLRDEREIAILAEAMKRLDMSAAAVVKKWVRLGQMVDNMAKNGYTEVVFRNAAGEENNPFDSGPKAAPMPPPVTGVTWATTAQQVLDKDFEDRTVEKIRTGYLVLESVSPTNSCNRHQDCWAANDEWLKQHPNERFVPFSFHCHDDECEDCFGQ